jgi:hypothetical protein
MAPTLKVEDLIANVVKYFQKEFDNGRPPISPSKVKPRAAMALGISESKVYDVLKKIDDAPVMAVVESLHQDYLKCKH